MSGTTVTSMSAWLQSDVFIIFVVVLLLEVIILVALCFVIRRHRIYSKTEKITQMEIAFPDVHLAALDTTNKPKFIMKIITEQKHASEIVQIAKDLTHSTDVGAVTPAVAPVTTAVAPVTPAVAPVTPAVAPVTPAVAPVTPAVAPVTPAVAPLTPAVASTSQDQPQTPLSSSDTEIDDSSPDEGSSTSSNVPTTSRPKHSVTTKVQSAKVPPSKKESSTSESEEYFST